MGWLTPLNSACPLVSTSLHPYPSEECCAWSLSHVTLCNPMDCSPPGTPIHGNSPVQNTGVGCHALLQGIFPGIKPRSPALQVDSLPSEPLGKPMNTGVGSLSLFQGILLTQASNQGLLYCKWILYQLGCSDQFSLH